MGATFQVQNFTQQERLSFASLGSDKAREIAWNHPAAALVVWYCARHRGDQIAFVSDNDTHEVFGHDPSKASLVFEDVTAREIASAVEAAILDDHGTISVDSELSLRDIRVCSSPRRLPNDDLHEF